MEFIKYTENLYNYNNLISMKHLSKVADIFVHMFKKSATCISIILASFSVCRNLSIKLIKRHALNMP